MEKTIFISIFDGDTEKNILRSGVLPLLKKSGHTIVLLIRSPKRLGYYEENFKDEQVAVEVLPPASSFFEVLYNHIGWNSIPTYSVFLRRHDMYLLHKNIVRYSAERLMGFLGRMRLWRGLLRTFYYAIPDSYASELFKKYEPDVVFAPNMFSAEDCRLLKAAKKRGIRTITTVKSWDVLTTKAFTRVKADTLLVFNEFNAQEAVELGDYRPEQVVITGFPQFDIYTDPTIIEPREEFCRKVDIEPSRRIILFAVPGDWKMAYTDEVIRHIDEAIADGGLPKDIRVLARVHPKYPTKVERRTDYAFVVIQRPGTYFSKDQERSLDTSAAKTLAWTFTDADIRDLANALYHCAMLINIESTMTLDVAAFDRPIILVGYDGDQKLPYLESIVRNYDRNHYKNVTETGGARVARNKDELLATIKAYLEHPELDQEGRKRLRDKLLYRVDGRSSERVGEAILALLQ